MNENKQKIILGIIIVILAAMLIAGIVLFILAFTQDSNNNSVRTTSNPSFSSVVSGSIQSGSTQSGSFSQTSSGSISSSFSSSQPPRQPGFVYSFAGNGINGDTGNGGPATEAAIGLCGNVAYDPQRNRLYIAVDFGVRMVDLNTPQNTITRILGQGGSGDPFAGSRCIDPSLFRTFSFPPPAIALRSDGLLFVGDSARGRILLYNPAVEIGFPAGKLSIYATGVGITTALAIDNTNNQLWIYDGIDNNLWRISSDQSQVCFGVPPTPTLITPSSGSIRLNTNTPIAIGAADLSGSVAFVANPTGNIVFSYRSESPNSVFFKITTTSNTFYESIGTGINPSSGTVINLNPSAWTLVDSSISSVLYVFNIVNFQGFIVSLPGNEISPALWGNGTNGYSGDGGPAIQAAFGVIQGMCLGPDNSLFVSDSQNFRVRLIQF